jgi:glycosyltransferase involved in cell wall biosynthesis
MEVIYVDSDSTDNSVEIAVKSGIDKVLRISGEINSAVARNVGAKYAESEWFLFVDGDMEIHSSFLIFAYEQNLFEKEDFYSGQFINIFYNSDWQEIRREEFHPAPSPKKEPAPGGLFFVRRAVWQELDGMRNYYKRSQDFDFGLRCAKKKYSFIRYNMLLATHHTISYLDTKRNEIFFKGKYYLYSRSLLYRDHILKNFNRKALQILVRQD